MVASRTSWKPWPATGTGFNPLHCGAVVASYGGRGALRSRRVSIPFIAGQWSLRTGAARAKEVRSFVSIPFIAGQWSLPHCPAAGRGGKGETFQSPSLRGSGRFSISCPSLPAPAVFQSPSLRGSGRFGSPPATFCRGGASFQSPSLRGSGRFWRPTGAGARKGSRVSIPFIAGQWSLRGAKEDHHMEVGVFQSPSLRGSGRFGNHGQDKVGGLPGFNPLHCGAVVASIGADLAEERCNVVSIPFIAGQWSLRGCWPRSWSGRSGFNPLHCGAVVASSAGRRRWRRWRFVSIPFIAGQWSLPPPPKGGGRSVCKFQSPSLRGSGRFYEA